MQEVLINQDLKIEAYDFGEFLLDFQNAVLKGYSLDLEDNARIPQKYGSHLSVVLKAQEKPDVQTVENTDAQAVESTDVQTVESTDVQTVEKPDVQTVEKPARKTKVK